MNASIMNNRLILFILINATMVSVSCKHQWLDAKPDKSLVVPTTVSDYQSLLDNQNVFNLSYLAISMVGDGDAYISDANYNKLGVAEEKAAYIWAATEDFYGNMVSSNWSSAYSLILQSNIIVDGLADMVPNLSNMDAYNNAKGSALFFRSYAYYNLSQAYCKTYNESTAATDLGLPLHLSANINDDVKRSSVQQTYDQLISDLKKAIPLLPVVPLHVMRPSRPAAYALLSRIYLSQENYPEALKYADSCLTLKNDLLNFNELIATASDPVTMFNKEVLFHAQLSSWTSFGVAYRIISPDLYALYTNDDDLRKTIYFYTNAGSLTFRAHYTGSRVKNFGGLAVDEMYLNRAECYARAGNIASALHDLNTLLTTRWRPGTYKDLTANSASQALSIILTERRKELCFRNLRWTDLRRLNKEPSLQVTLAHTVNGQTYTLEPNSPRYVLPLDPIETTLGGLEQNPR